MMENIIDNKSSFVFYESVYKQANALHKRNKKEEELELLRAIMEFGLYGVIPEEESDVWLYGFEQAATSISAAKTRYEAAKENGSKGGRPVKFPMMDMVKYREQGMTNNQIAAYMGCSPKTVETKLKQYDISNPEYSQERKNRKNLNENYTVNNNNNDNNNDTVNDTVNDNNNNNKECNSLLANASTPPYTSSSLCGDGSVNPKDNKLDF